MVSVKSSELHKYKPEQILFSQDSDDVEELENRVKRQKAKIQKVHKASIAKRNASNKPKTKKKKLSNNEI